jgi:glycosyltransferase involved in cell wall biosynthesis
MRISIIIPTKNRKEDLLVTLQSIVAQSRPPEEIIIVDQSLESCEGEIEGLFFPVKDTAKVVYIWDRNVPGPAMARTKGFENSSGEIVFFVDDDVTLEGDCIERLLQTYETNPHIDGIGGVDTRIATQNLLWLMAKSLFTCGPFSLKKGGWFFTGWAPSYFHNRLTTPYPSQWLFEGIMSFRRYVVKDVGFDKKLTGHVFIAGIDFNYRASKKYLLVIDPKVKGYHRGGMVSLYNMKQDHEKRVSGEWYFFRKNIQGTTLNTLFFAWRLLGSLLVASAISLYYGSLDPLRGFWSGMKIGATRYRRVFYDKGVVK